MTRSPALRRLTKWMAADASPRPRWAEHQRMADRARIVVQIFYLFALYHLAGFVWRLQKLAVTDPGSFEPQWPVAWMAVAGLPLSASLLIPGVIFAGVAGVIWWRRLWIRALVALMLLQLVALANSWGAISHGYHELFWISVCLMFLPNGTDEEVDASRARRMQLLTAVGGAMALILMFYSLSGFYKALDATWMLASGQFGGFHPDAMATTLARRQAETMTQPIYADIIMDNPLLGWPIFLAVYYAELVAILIFFRPSLHVAWGMGLILFHFGTIVFLEISFPLHIAFNAMLFMLSPFAPWTHDLRTMAASLPWFGWPLRRYAGWRAG